MLLYISCQDSTSKATRPTIKQKADTEISPSANQATTTKKKTILFFGNSLTAGLGVDPTEAFAGVIEYRIDSLKLPYQVVNSGVSGETTAGGLGRIDWILDQYTIDIFAI